MKLNEVCIGITDGSHNPPAGIKKSEYPMLSSKNIFDDVLTFDEPRYLSETEYEKENKRTCVNAGDVLLTIVGTVGRALVVPEGADNITLQRSVAVLHPNYEKCRSRYLMYLLQSKRSYFENKARGVAQKGIYLKQLSDVDVNICGLDEQDEIIKLLDKTRNIITVRRKQLGQLDLLVKARFVELFGDPVTNPKNLPVVILRELSRLITKGASPSWQGFSYTEDSSQTLFITSENVREGYIDLSSPKYVEDGFNEKQNRSMIHKGDFLINIVGASIGRAAQFELDCKANMNQAAALVRMDDNRIRDKYLLVYLNSERAQQMYNSMKSDTGRATLSLQDIADLSILLPEVNEQIEFETFVRQVDKSKLSPKQSTTLHYKSIFTQIQTLQITNIFYLETESEAFHQNDKRRIISMGKTRIWHGSGISVEGFERSAASGG